MGDKQEQFKEQKHKKKKQGRAAHHVEAEQQETRGNGAKKQIYLSVSVQQQAGHNMGRHDR